MAYEYLTRIGKVLTKQKHGESMAYKKTQLHLIWCGGYRANFPLAGSTSVLAAIADWTTLGLSAGFRISEYGQTSAKIWKEWMSIGTNGAAKHLPQAFIHSDFTFFDEQWPLLPMHNCHKAHFVRITWRKQKNGNISRNVTFGTSVDAQLCPVLAAIRIYTRALHLNHDMVY